MLDFLSLKKSISTIGTSVRELGAEIEHKKRQREELLISPMSRDELADGLCKMLDASASVYPERLAKATAFIRENPFFDFESSRLDFIGTMGAGNQVNILPRENVAWFLSDLLKQRIRDAVAAMEWPQGSVKLTRAERKKAIEKLDKEIADLESRQKSILDEAHAAGIRL